ncbi:NfeD family protein [Janibacter sp. GS2]|uniref:NfeD family protein n=1 Tax=Janibacter sp. GS2 TaxID=3442646 RepID=UPI003EBB4D0E
MAASQLDGSGRGPVRQDLDLGDVLSRIADELGLGWGTVLGLVVPTLLVLVVGVTLTVLLWRRTRGAPSNSTGADLFEGRVVTVTTAQGSRGQAFVEGSWWAVRTTGATLQVGQEVRVRAVDGLVLLVEDPDMHTTRDEGEM